MATVLASIDFNKVHLEFSNIPIFYSVNFKNISLSASGVSECKRKLVEKLLYEVEDVNKNVLYIFVVK